jgi:hypothetical protein
VLKCQEMSQAQKRTIKPLKLNPNPQERQTIDPNPHPCAADGELPSFEGRWSTRTREYNNSKPQALFQHERNTYEPSAY